MPEFEKVNVAQPPGVVMEFAKTMFTFSIGTCFTGTRRMPSRGPSTRSTGYSAPDLWCYGSIIVELKAAEPKASPARETAERTMQFLLGAILIR